MAANVLLIEDMEHNLLSVNQTCDKGNFMIFDSKHCQIRDVKTNQLRKIVESIYVKIDESSSLK